MHCFPLNFFEEFNYTEIITNFLSKIEKLDLKKKIMLNFLDVTSKISGKKCLS